MKRTLRTLNKNYKKLKAKKSNNVIFSPMPLENEGNPEGLQLLRESLRKVQLESPDKVSLFTCRGTETFITRFIHNRYRKISFRSREAVNKLLSRFFPLRGYHSPPTPIAENNFAKKPLSVIGGPPPFSGKNS